MPDEMSIETFGADGEVQRIRNERMESDRTERIAEEIGEAVRDVLESKLDELLDSRRRDDQPEEILQPQTVETIEREFAEETVAEGADEIDRVRQEQIQDDVEAIRVAVEELVSRTQ